MRRPSRIVTPLLGVMFGLITAPAARAGCASPDVNAAWRQPQSYLRPGPLHSPGFILASSGDSQSDAAIVGFWRVTFVSKGSTYIPDDTVVDWGYVQWHSDGTEIMNSSRPPATSSFCLGVWKKTGPSTYKLNHLALSWNPDGTPLGPATITEEVVLDHGGNSYRGSFTIEQFDLSGVHILPPTPIVGVVTGTRITVN